MTLQRNTTDFETLPPETIDAWREIPPDVVSDCMNRTHFMAATIKPVRPGTGGAAAAELRARRRWNRPKSKFSTRTTRQSS